MTAEAIQQDAHDVPFVYKCFGACSQTIHGERAATDFINEVKTEVVCCKFKGFLAYLQALRDVPT